MNFDPLLEFIKTYYPVNDAGMIALHEPVLDGNEKKYLADCIDTTYVSSVGAYVTKFEEMLSQICDVKHAVAMSNGTSALHIGLMISNVTADTEVITQPLTFIATCGAIKYLNAHPVFVDVDTQTMGMCPTALQKFIDTQTIKKSDGLYNKQTGRRISACVPMHVFGHACRIDEITEICNFNNIPLIEDAAEGVGSYYNGKHLGSFGQIGMLSFNGNKTVTCGGGGALITNDDALAERARHLSTTARIQDGYEFVHDEVGYNYRLTNVNAAIGCAQLERLSDFIQIKREMAKRYKAFVNDISDIIFMSEPENTQSNYWFNTIRVKNKKIRDEFLEIANSQNIQCRPVWKLMTDMPMFKDCQHDGIENARALYETLVNLPSSANAKL